MPHRNHFSDVEISPQSTLLTKSSRDYIAGGDPHALMACSGVLLRTPVFVSDNGTGMVVGWKKLEHRQRSGTMRKEATLLQEMANFRWLWTDLITSTVLLGHQNICCYLLIDLIEAFRREERQDTLQSKCSFPTSSQAQILNPQLLSHLHTCSIIRLVILLHSARTYTDHTDH
ncbi:hypothetical protein MRB53_039490 [Persea americana]|nr:hypothetical protein MRB53_039490 [Persea americana]